MRMIRRSALFGGAVVVVAVGLSAGVMLFNVFVADFGFHPEADARVWAGREISYAITADCVGCHAPEVERLASARHVEIGCQSCHGPLEAHVLASDPDSTTVPVAVPGSDLCVRCHTTAIARPAFLPQVTPADHYTDGCIDCHEPHSGISKKPPVVSHPLVKLPDCIVCHGPDGFRARTDRHPDEPTEDRVCLACHERGRGVIDVAEPEGASE